MANPEHLEILKQGVEVWNQWRKENPEIRPDLFGAELGDANLNRANLSSAKLSNASLISANFTGANLSNADFRGANLSHGNFNHAKLNGADLSNTYLINANLSNAILIGADFSLAGINYTTFGNNDLSAVVGLDSVRFWGPATIGIDTLQKSKGKIPEVFLRGCGLSDWQIENAKLFNPDLSNEEVNNTLYRIHDLRMARAFQVSPLFISYSHNNSDFVNAIEQLLIIEGIRFWRDIHHAKAGRLEKQIDAAIHANDVVLLILSEHSTNSDWVEHEARKAREKEKKTGKDAMCPIALDESWKTCSWPARLREQMMEYNILDFSNWHDAPTFNKQFSKLVEGLNLFYK